MLVRRLAKGLPKPVENLKPPAIFHWSALSKSCDMEYFRKLFSLGFLSSEYSISTRLPHIPSPGGSAR